MHYIFFIRIQQIFILLHVHVHGCGVSSCKDHSEAERDEWLLAAWVVICDHHCAGLHKLQGWLELRGCDVTDDIDVVQVCNDFKAKPCETYVYTCSTSSCSIGYSRYYTNHSATEFSFVLLTVVELEVQLGTVVSPRTDSNLALEQSNVE